MALSVELQQLYIHNPANGTLPRAYEIFHTTHSCKPMGVFNTADNYHCYA